MREIADVFDSTGKHFGRNDRGVENLENYRSLDLGIVRKVNDALESSAEFPNEFIATVTTVESIVHRNPVWVERT
jgi:hypothetical protein